MYLVKTPPIIKTLFSDYIWKVATVEKEVFLTFDDGPIPELTPWVLDLLLEYDFKATFFCVGQNVEKYPMIYDRIISEGHSIGNHTYNHLNGWSNEIDSYLDNVHLCDELINSELFRPPYGKLKPGQAAKLKNEKTIVMWDILSGDFDASLTNEKCLSNVIENYQSGSIIVFHDNIKSKEKLMFVLPFFLEHLKQNGFKSANLECLIPEYA